METRLLRRYAALLLALTYLATGARAETSEAEEAFMDTFVNVWHDQKQMVTAPLRLNRVDFLVWGTAAGSLLYLAPTWGSKPSGDERFEQGLNRGNGGLNDFMKGFTHVGDAPVLFGVTLTSYGVSRWQEWPQARRASLHVFEGLMDAGIAAEAIKMLAGRRRPVDTPSHGPFLGPRGYFSDSDDAAFVSGHAALTFVTATIISHESGSYWVGIPAYLIAGGVSYSRIYVARHWLSDVIGGAALGYSIGILVEHRRHSKPKLAGAFYPTVSQNSTGIGWSTPF